MGWGARLSLRVGRGPKQKLTRCRLRLATGVSRLKDGRSCVPAWPGPARAELRQLAAAPGEPRRFAPNQLRHAHAVELARESVAVNIIQLQLGHTDLGTTSAYLQGIDPSEIVDTVRFRRPPIMSATAGLAP